MERLPEVSKFLWLGFSKSLNAPFSRGKVDLCGQTKTKHFPSLFLAWLLLAEKTGVQFTSLEIVEGEE